MHHRPENAIEAGEGKKGAGVTSDSTNAGKPAERRGKKPEQRPEVDRQRKYRTELHT